MGEQTLADALVAKATDLFKCHRRFLSHVLMLFLSINFTQLAPHSSRYCERSMRLNFESSIDRERLTRN